MIVRRYVLGVACASLLLLAGCNHGNNAQIITFEPFSFGIPVGYQSVSAGLVENKQILHKVVKSFKLPTEEGVFSPNIIITSTAVSPTLDYDQFWTANNNKIQQDLAGYKAGKKDVITFACNGEEIQGVYLLFEVTDTFYTTKQTYYMAQYQFVYNGQGYIISYATADPDQQDELRDWIETLQCN